LVLGEAFVRGMRDIGYKHTGTAIDELIDNAIEAGAKNVHVVFGYHKDNKSKGKPDMLAVVDDGHGMLPSMIRAAVIWGGTHREGSRELFGRYGFGLPSSCVSQARRFEVYSRTDGGEWHMVAIDLDEIAEGRFHQEAGRLAAPPPAAAVLPSWVQKAVETQFGKTDLTHGTVILISALDRLSPGMRTTQSLETALLQHFGVTYRNYLREVSVHVNGKAVEPVDPLFLDPTARFYDENDLRARALAEPTLVEVKDGERKKLLGVIKVRYSYMPPGFQNEGGKLRTKNNSRFNIMKENNGILVLRAGRQIDVVSAKCPWTTFVNYDRNWKVEIDFPPILDEQFSITTSKQQIVVSDRVWALLKEAGVERAISALRRQYEDDRTEKEKDEEQPGEGETRTSEDVMEEAQKYKTRPSTETPEQLDEREKRRQKELEERIKRTGKTREEVERDLEFELATNPFRIGYESVPGGDFYRVEAIGPQVHVIINQSHPFFTDVYHAPDSTPRLRAALELLLFVMSECELGAILERQIFYQSERREWSHHLGIVLRLLNATGSTTDMASSRMEMAELEADSEGDLAPKN